MKTLKKYWKIGVAVLLLVIGFFVGRQTSEIKTTTKLVPGKTVTDTLYAEQLSPFHSEIPDNPVLPTKSDTLYLPGDSVSYAVVQVVDTARIIREYITKNSYRKQLFDDDNGKLTVSADVQYNLLQKLSYEFTPIHKVTTIEKKRVFTPFMVGSYSTNKWIGAGMGTYYYDVGVSVQYQTDFTSKNYLFSLYYKL